MAKLKELFPKIKPYREGFLRVSPLHSIHYEECGNPKGKPLVFLHGGPGGGIEPVYPRYFNPRKWRVVLFDQRGFGLIRRSQSNPSRAFAPGPGAHVPSGISCLR